MAETLTPKTPQSWYIVPQSSGECSILNIHQLSAYTEQGEENRGDDEDAQGEMPTLEFWGPFETKEEAIAKRIGLIRSGRCKPM